MIEHYSFIDKNADGDKERFIAGVIQLYNKLSADETNAIRDKLNELVDALNFTQVPLFGVFTLKFKGDGNTDPYNIEVGDIAKRYSEDGIIENALFNGGDPQDPANYTIFAPVFEPKVFIATGAINEFDLPAGMTAGQVFVDRGMLYKNTDDYAGEWDQDGVTVEILGDLLEAGQKVYIISI